MKKYGFSHFRKWLLLYVTIIVLTTLVAYLYVYNELTNMLAASAWTTADTVAPGTSSNAALPSLAGIKLRILLLLSITFTIILFFSLLWFRTTLHQINRPILAIRRAVNRLAQGKLNETVTLDSHDELGQIGTGINELAANLQELLLHIWKQTGRCTAILEQIGSDPNPVNGNVHTHLLELKTAVDNLREMAKAYVFYDVRLEGEQAIAINEPGRKGQPSVPPPQSSLSE